MIIIKLFFFFSFSLISHSDSINQAPFMIYWLTSYSLKDISKFLRETRFPQMDQLKYMNGVKSICHLKQMKEVFLAMSLDYVHIKGFNPFFIEMVNSSIEKDYTLVSFNVQNFQQT
jgi:hypothetical protein